MIELRREQPETLIWKAAPTQGVGVATEALFAFA